MIGGSIKHYCDVLLGRVHCDWGQHQPARHAADRGHPRWGRHHTLTDRQTGGGGSDLKGVCVVCVCVCVCVRACVRACVSACMHGVVCGGEGGVHVCAH